MLYTYNIEILTNRKAHGTKLVSTNKFNDMNVQAMIRNEPQNSSHNSNRKHKKTTQQKIKQ